MRERFFEQGERVNKKVDAIKRELSDSGISDPSEWRKAIDLETPLDEAEEKFLGESPERRSFTKLLTYLEGEKKLSDKEKIKQYEETEDSIERLELLRTMSLADAITAIREHSDTEGSFKYLANRLDFYQKFIQGQATRRQTEREWDSNKGEYVDVVKEYEIDASNATPETVRLGLLRDMEFAAMIGTPELGIYKITDKRLKAKNGSRTHMPELKGYHSGIHEGSIGYAYPFLRSLYEKARKSVEARSKNQDVDEQTLEHRSVITAANWLEEAMDYNPSGRGPGSPYVGSLDESIAWARLGEGVKRQLRGMRQKIQDIDLHNIERFIGRSGVDKYDSERKRVFGQIKFLRDGYDKDKKREFVEKENDFALKKQQHWFEQETERLAKKFEKSKAEIEKLHLPDDEKELQLQSTVASHERAMAELQEDYQERSGYLQARTPEQLLTDLEQRQNVVNERHEKRKSLAQKALDLHFKINHTGGDYDSKPLAGIVDWINYAPFGVIKRSHKMMRLGISEETIIEHALADIVAGKRGATREDLKVIHDLVSQAKGQDWNARQKLESMMKVGNILSITGNEVTLDEVAELAGKNFYGMTEALKMYDLDQVKAFIDRNINLQSITSARKITEKFGHDLSPEEIADIASHDINGLEDALRTFELDSVVTLLRQDVNLPVAVAVLNNTRQFGYELDIGQIASIAKNAQDIEDFTSALRELPLAEVEKLFTIGVPYREFSTVKAALEKHGLSSDFNASLSVAQKLIKHREYDSLDRALDFYSLAEIDQIIAKDVTLGNILSVRGVLEQKGVETTLQETVEFAKNGGDHYSSSYRVGQAIDTFGIESVRKIVAKRCPLYKAIEVNNYINNGSRSRYGSSDNEMSESLRESLKKGGLDVVIAIGRAGNMEAAVKTVEAGFTVDEITRFPFLISPLVTRK